MNSVPFRYFAGLVLVLFASAAFSQSVIEQILAGQSKGDQSPLVGIPDAIVLTIDGIDKALLPEAKSIFGVLAGGRGDSYLQGPVSEKWSFAKDIRYYPWSGDLARTDQDIQNLKIQIAGLAEIGKRRGQPFVILAHSWGSVLAYRAISELNQEGGLEEGAIRKLVTIGSPINGQFEMARIASNKHINWKGVQGVVGLTKSWTNFWIDRDETSGPIEGLDHNVELKYAFANPHKAYFANSSLLGRIGETVAVDLATFVATEQATGSSAPPSEPMPVASATVASNNIVLAQAGPESEPLQNRDGPFCLSEVCIGDRPADVLATVRPVSIKSNDFRKWTLELVKGPTLEEIKFLGARFDNEGPNAEKALDILGKIHTVCGLVQPFNMQFPEDVTVVLAAKKADNDNYQGFQVSSITKTYSVPSNRHDEWLRALLSKYPDAFERGRAKVKKNPDGSIPPISVFYSYMTRGIGTVTISSYELSYAQINRDEFWTHSNCQSDNQESFDF